MYCLDVRNANLCESNECDCVMQFGCNGAALWLCEHKLLDKFLFSMHCILNVLYFCVTCPFCSFVNSNISVIIIFCTLIRTSTQFVTRNFQAAFLFSCWVDEEPFGLLLECIMKIDFDWIHCAHTFLCLFQSGERTMRNKHYFIFTNVEHYIYNAERFSWCSVHFFHILDFLFLLLFFFLSLSLCCYLWDSEWTDVVSVRYCSFRAKMYISCVWMEQSGQLLILLVVCLVLKCNAVLSMHSMWLCLPFSPFFHRKFQNLIRIQIIFDSHLTVDRKHIWTFKINGNYKYNNQFYALFL